MQMMEQDCVLFPIIIWAFTLHSMTQFQVQYIHPPDQIKVFAQMESFIFFQCLTE